MKSIKTMLLGIAFLIVACCGVPFWAAGAGVGAVVFFCGAHCWIDSLFQRLFYQRNMIHDKGGVL